MRETREKADDEGKGQKSGRFFLIIKRILVFEKYACFAHLVGWLVSYKGWVKNKCRNQGTKVPPEASPTTHELHRAKLCVNKTSHHR
jgi:hypothetical protein